MILNSNRLRTFEGARLEIVTYVEAKFGLRNRDCKPSDTGSRGHSDTVDVDAVDSLSLSSSKGEGSSGPRERVFQVRWSTFSTRLQCKQEHRQTIVWQQANRASHGPRVKAKERVKRTRGNPKDSPKDPKVPKAHARAKLRKTGISGLENLKSEISSETQESARTCPTDSSWNDGWNW